MQEIILTTDVLIFVGDFEKLLLIRRGKEPDFGKLAFPGGHLEKDEKLKDCGVREVREETGLALEVEELNPFEFLDEPGRDPRPGRRISFVYSVFLEKDDSRLEHVKAGDDAVEVLFLSLGEISKEDMAFDHWNVIETLKKRLS